MHEFVETTTKEELLQEFRNKFSVLKDQVVQLEEMLRAGTIPYDDIAHILSSISERMADCAANVEKTHNIQDENKLKVLQDSAIETVKRANSNVGQYFAALIAYYKAAAYKNVPQGEWSETQSLVLADVKKQLTSNPILTSQPAFRTITDAVLRDLDIMLNKRQDDKEVKRKYELDPNTFSNLEEFFKNIDFKLLESFDGVRVLSEKTKFIVEGFLRTVKIKTYLSQTAKTLDWDKGQVGIMDAISEVETQCSLYLVDSVKDSNPDFYQNLQAIRELLYRLLHEDQINRADARESIAHPKNENRKYLRPSTKLIPEEIYGEVMMFMGEIASEIVAAEVYGVNVARGEKLSKKEKIELEQILTKIATIKKRHKTLRNLGQAERMYGESTLRRMDSLIAEIEKYYLWVQTVYEDAVFEDEAPVESGGILRVSGDLERPTVDTTAAYGEWLDRRLVAAESNPEIYKAILSEVRALILDRLNLKYESSHSKWSDSSLYASYSDLSKRIKVNDSDPNKEMLAKLKIKTGEMEKIRTITDVAHLGGVSNAMSSNWEEFAKQEGSNGLSVLYYDYFLQKWGDGSKRSRAEVVGGQEENAYKYATIMNKTVFAYLEWLRLGTIPRILEKKAKREGKNPKEYYDNGTKWNDGPIWKGKARRFYMDFFLATAKAHEISLEPGDEEEVDGLLYNICYGLGIRQHAFIDQYAVGATPNGRLGDLFSWIEDIQILARHNYKGYKGVKYIPSAEMHQMPEDWNELVREKGLVAPGRLRNIRNGVRGTRLMLKVFAPLRDVAYIGAVYPGHGEGMSKDEIFKRGTRLKSPYQTLFEAVFIDAEKRREFGKKGKDFTFVEYINGHKAFKDFREHIFEVPGRVFGSLSDRGKPDELFEMAIEEINKISIDALMAKIVGETGWLRILVQDYFSYLKKNWASMDPNQIASMFPAAIDKVFRVMAQHKDAKPHHFRYVLEQIWIMVENAENTKDMCKRHEIYGVRDDEPLAFSQGATYNEKGEIVSKEGARNPEDWDIRDYILNRMPRVINVSHGGTAFVRAIRPAAELRDKPIRVMWGPGGMGDIKRAKPVRISDLKLRARHRWELYWELRRMRSGDNIRSQQYHTLGIPKAEQDKKS